MTNVQNPLAAEGLKKKAQEIKRLYAEGITGIVRAGQELLALKLEMVGTGGDRAEGYREFRQWYETVLGWPKPQVNRLTDIAAAFAEHLDLVTRFDLSALYVLARAPEQVRQTALERAEAGEFISHKLAQELMGRGKGRKNGRRPKHYKIGLESGAVFVTAPHRTLSDVRAALAAALEKIEEKIAKKKK